MFLLTAYNQRTKDNREGRCCIALRGDNMKKAGKKPKEVSYLAVGIALGAAVGAAIKNIGLGLAIGLAIGAGMDAKKSKKDE